MTKKHAYEEWVVSNEATIGMPNFETGVGYVIFDSDRRWTSSPGMGPGYGSAPVIMINGHWWYIHPLSGSHEFNDPDSRWHRDDAYAGTRVTMTHHRKQLAHKKATWEQAPLRAAAREMHGHAQVIVNDKYDRNPCPKWWVWENAVKFRDEEIGGWVYLHPAPVLAGPMPEDTDRFLVCKFAYPEHPTRWGKPESEEDPAEVLSICPVPLAKIGPVIGAETAAALAEKMQGEEVGRVHWTYVRIIAGRTGPRVEVIDTPMEQLRKYWLEDGRYELGPRTDQIRPEHRSKILQILGE